MGWQQPEAGLSALCSYLSLEKYQHKTHSTTPPPPTPPEVVFFLSWIAFWSTVDILDINIDFFFFLEIIPLFCIYF